MVVKLDVYRNSVSTEFESRVILDGSQTTLSYNASKYGFESRVILDGSQTYKPNRVSGEPV